MDEISRCCKILGVEPETPLEDVKKAYEDLAEAWQPDRFVGNERLKLKAQETLKEINAAYEFLIASAFQKEVPIAIPKVAVPVPALQSVQQPVSQKDFGAPASTTERKWEVIGITVAVVLVIFGGLFFYLKSQQHADSVAPASQGTNALSETNLLPSVATNNQGPVPEQK